MDGIAFDGNLAEAAPMGGAEAAFVGLAEALARARPSRRRANNCAAPPTITRRLATPRRLRA